VGTVAKTNRDIGVQFDRYGGHITTVRRTIAGVTHHIFEYCEAVGETPTM